MENVKQKGPMQKFMSNATLDRSAVRTNNAGSERAAYKFKGRKTYRNQLSIADYTFLIQVVFLQETICAHCLKGSAGAAKIHWTRAGPHNAVLPQAAGRYREKSQDEPPLSAGPLPAWLGKILAIHPELPPARRPARRLDLR